PLAANPATLTLAAAEGTSTAPALVTVTAPSWNPAVTAEVEYSGAAGWLQVTRVAGGFQLVGNAGTLRADAYYAQLRLRGAYPAVDVLVPVSFTVGRGIAVPGAEPVAVDAETTTVELHRSIPVLRAGGGTPVNWTAASDAAWATLGQDSGVTGDNLEITVDPAFVTSLPNGAVRTARVTITPAVANFSAVAFDVVLTKTLPELSRVGPYVQLAGQPFRVLVRGSGLSSVTSLADRIVVDGGTVLSAVRRGDREAEIHVGPLSAGTHAISVTNALGLATPAATLKVVTPPVHDYAAVPTGHPLRYLTYDVERSAIYAADITGQALVRFRLTPSGWATDSVPVPAIYDAGLTQDGSTLLVSTNNFQTVSTIRSLDPDTLAQQSLFVATSTFNPTFTYLGFGITSTLDGLAWFGLDDLAGSGQWADLVTFDPAVGNVAPVSVGLSTTFHGGPWFAASRDGGRLVIVQSASISPSPPMLYRDSSDGVVRVNPAGLQFSYRLSLSDDARRIMLDNYEVRDQNFGLVGAIQLPSGRYPATGQMHPNGTRAYVVTTDSNGEDWRVYVLDTASYQAALPVLGYFPLPDAPGCLECQSQTFPSAITPDGSTLFVAGNTNLIVAPIPDVLTPAAARVGPLAAPMERRIRTTPWKLPAAQVMPDL
ncbi:MAG: BACON domain-containing protein, partial [Gammaproteobacteria bacterium]|nr:BACON domain-containing protein [Gammaproteobacteria bacterium]